MTTARFCAPDGSELRVVLTGAELVLGRPGGDAGVALDGDRALSRRHGRIWRDGDQLWYEDLGSANGSWHENRRVDRPVELRVGSKIRLGNTILTLEEEVAQPPATVRMAVPATGQLSE